MRELKACTTQQQQLPQKRKREIEAISIKLTQEEQESETSQEENNAAPKAVIASHPREINRKKVYFYLDNAALGKIQLKKKGKGRVAHSVDDADDIYRQKKSIELYRSDIVHEAQFRTYVLSLGVGTPSFKQKLVDLKDAVLREALRAIFDSPLCKYGMVGGIYMKVQNGPLLEIKPHVRIMRTLPRFCGVMLDVLTKSLVRAKESNEKLIHVIDQPVTRHLPPNSHIIGISVDSKKVVDIERYISAATDDRNLVFVIGASVNGKFNEQYTEDIISVSNYPTAPRWRIELVCEALENMWKIF